MPGRWGHKRLREAPTTGKAAHHGSRPSALTRPTNLADSIAPIWCFPQSAAVRQASHRDLTRSKHGGTHSTHPLHSPALAANTTSTPQAAKAACRRQDVIPLAIADLEKAQSTIPHRACHTCHLLSELPKDKAKRLLRLLSNPGVRYTELAYELATDPEWGINIDHQSLSRHARAAGKVHRGMTPLRGSR